MFLFNVFHLVESTKYQVLAKVGFCNIPDPFRFGMGLERYTETQSTRNKITVRAEQVLPKCCQKSIIKSHPIYNLVLYTH